MTLKMLLPQILYVSIYCNFLHNSSILLGQNHPTLSHSRWVESCFFRRKSALRYGVEMDFISLLANTEKRILF